MKQFSSISLRFISVLFFIISLSFIKFVYAEQIYYPYPIVFVHGINSSDGMWVNMRDSLRQYFRTAQGMGEYKYPGQDSEMNYFVGCDYKSQNNGNIPDIAKDILRLKIDKALFYYPPAIPENERKVIIVCHSMGGLVMRSLLTQNSAYQDKIHRVVFIDTPHLGSPLASALWLFNEIRNGRGEISLTHKQTAYHSFSAFSPSVFRYPECVEYAIICSEIFNTHMHILTLLIPLDFKGPKPAGEAVRDLRTPASTSYNAAYSGFLSGLTVTESKSYSSTDTFLGQTNLYVPSDSKVITGKNTLGWETAEWGLDKLLKFSSPFTFSNLAGEPQTIDNAVRNGDGVVTMSSQKAVTGKADYQVSGFHVGVADNAINETLQAIEDDPVIEKVYAIPEKWNATPADDSYNSYYLIFKVKDYLLADIEMETLTIDGRSIIPEDFKPYNAIGQAFLKERICNGKDSPKETAGYHDIYDDNINNDSIKYPTLMPGEFFIKTKISQDAQSLYIKIKNPAAQYNSDLTNPDKFTAKKTFYFMRPKVSAFRTSNIDLPPLQGNGSGSPQWPLSSSLYFDIKDSPTQNVMVNVWLYSDLYNQKIVKKFATNYGDIPWASSRIETLPDGETEITLHSGGYDSEHTFATWSGETEPGVTLLPSSHEDGWKYYYLKVTTEPLDSNPSDNLIFVLDSGVTSIAADPTFIQPSRREGVTW